jgi:phosphatidylethanolamine/phosphatidyl-N-methylethanolamine N-methyltransferase
MLPKPPGTSSANEEGMKYWTECREFFRQFRQAYFTTGSIWPSSRSLGRALAAPLRKSRPPRRILEVGPGTGAVTVEILRQLRPGDRLDIVEINARFIALLAERFAEDVLFRPYRHQVRLLHMPLQQVPGEHVYDFMISGLPLNNFPVALVREIFASYERLLKPQGVLSYFEYLAIRKIKTAVVGRKTRKRLHVLSRLLERRIRKYQVGAERVFFNVPPAIARHFCFRGTGSQSVRKYLTG